MKNTGNPLLNSTSGFFVFIIQIFIKQFTNTTSRDFPISIADLQLIPGSAGYPLTLIYT